MQHLSRIHLVAVYGFEGKEEFHCPDSLEISKSAKSIEAFCWGINQHWRFEVFLKRQVKWINWKKFEPDIPVHCFFCKDTHSFQKGSKRRIGWIVHIQAEVPAFCFMVYHGVPTSLSSRPPKPSQHSCLETRMDLATSLSSALRVESNQIPISLNKNRDGWNSSDPFFFLQEPVTQLWSWPFFPCFFNTWTPQSSSAHVLLLCFTNQNNPESRATIPYPTYHLEILYRVKFLGLAPIESLPRQKHPSGIIFSKDVEDAKCW